MKKLMSIMLALAVCLAALSLPAAAAEPDLAPVRVWGQVSPWDGDGIFLKNDDPEDPMNEVVVHLGDAPVVDAAAGLPLDAESIQEGDTLYVWVGPAATMSLPPQVSAIAAVGNVPEDAAVPEYYVIAGEPVAPASGEEGPVRFPVLGGETLAVTEETVYTPWLTRQIVQMEDLIPGTQVLVWKDAEDQAEKVLVFPYGYTGYLNAVAASHGHVLVCVNGTFDGNTPQALCKKTEDGIVLAPIRAVAEAAGYDVRWDKELGAVVSLNGETVLSAKPGSDIIQTPEGEASVSAPCVYEAGVTYLPAVELAYWLNLFFVR